MQQQSLSDLLTNIRLMGKETELIHSVIDCSLNFFNNSVVIPSIELKPTILMWQCFHVLQFHLYQQKYQQYAKVPPIFEQ